MSATRPSRSSASERTARRSTRPPIAGRPGAEAAGADLPTAELELLPADRSAYEGPADLAMLRARRRAARRRSRLARLDVAIGVLAAIVLLVVSPGLAMTAVIALGLLVACLVWITAERRLRRRGPRGRARTRAGRRRARTPRPGDRR